MSSQNYDALIRSLVQDSNSIIEWFDFNCMQANTDKFQDIAVSKKTHNLQSVFNIKNVNIKCNECVKCLGVDI